MISLHKLKQLYPLSRTTSNIRLSSTATNANSQIKPQVYNRNPRNLERLRIARKPQGFGLDAPGRAYWHKLFVTEGSRHVSAKVVHYSGSVVVQASTNEWCIRKHLYSARDKSAYSNLAKILARRCLESGIIEMDNGLSTTDPGTKTGNFATVMEQEGISLMEPKRYEHAYPFHQLRPEKPWTVTED